MSEEQFFSPVNSDTPITEIQSLCMNCHEQGMTRLLLTSIPFFREVVLMSFACPHCHFRNNEIQSASAIQDLGCRYTVRVSKPEDLNRELVKSESATVMIPELEFELTPMNQKGQLTTIEGILSRAIEGLSSEQEERRKLFPEEAAQIDAYVARLEAAKSLSAPFTFIVDDPAGNSFIQTLTPPLLDPALQLSKYTRTVEQDVQLGVASDGVFAEDGDEDQEAQDETPADEKGDSVVEAAASEESPKPAVLATVTASSQPEKKAFKKPVHGVTSFYGMTEENANYHVSEEVDIIPTHCSSCRAPGDFKSYYTRIPYFKEVIIMSFTCDFCGFKTNDIKPGGATSDKGLTITLKVSEAKDMERDILKSDTASIEVPEIGLELASGTLGGKLTTVEGILQSAKEQLVQASSFMMGDSAGMGDRENFVKFFRDLDSILALERPFTFIMHDPMGNSFIGSSEDPTLDPKLILNAFERSYDQNEELGLNDIKTE
eukprot:TRINITY_DN2608_c0_g1_i1.p1 TRINITY_DN2608_c0_g1~~TRINITY_DN2608_c0_g1_i1.p1  ORF type:complete len:489 (-),score=114.03 TRINITY_DN2608_c0_g1_i1:144-1610(-)